LLPDEFNAAEYFVDRHMREGRAEKVAIECGDAQLTYGLLFDRMNRFGNGLQKLGVRMEERIVLLLLDTPDFAVSFFGAIKIGAVPVPVNTLLKSADYKYLLNNSRARIMVVSDSLLPLVQAIPREELTYLDVIVVAGEAPPGTIPLNELIGASSQDLQPASTRKTMLLSGYIPPAVLDSPKDAFTCSTIWSSAANVMPRPS
jgi:benzoate-CoA ligase